MVKTIMSDYIQVSKQHYYSLSTEKLYTRAELTTPCNIMYPWFIDEDSGETEAGFRMVNGSPVPLFNRRVRTDVIQIKDWSIQNLGGTQAHGYPNGKTYTTRSYMVYMQDVKAQLMCSCQDGYLSTKGTAFGTVQRPLLYDTIVKNARYCMRAMNGHVNVEDVGGYLPFGLTPTMYSLRYKDRIVKGTCMVFFLGFIGLILKDDLSIDAVAILSGWRQALASGDMYSFGVDVPKKLCLVDEIIWTKNPYLAKLKSLV